MGTKTQRKRIWQFVQNYNINLSFDLAILFLESTQDVQSTHPSMTAPVNLPLILLVIFSCKGLELQRNERLKI